MVSLNDGVDNDYLRVTIFYYIILINFYSIIIYDIFVQTKISSKVGV